MSATQLTAAIPAADIATAGTASVTVVTPAPGGGTSAAQTFTINNPGAGADDAVAEQRDGRRRGVHADGDGQRASCAALDGAAGTARPRTTTFVSATQLTAAIPAADIATAGTASVTVVKPAPGGGTSAAQTFTINPAAAISISPTSAAGGDGGNGVPPLTFDGHRWNRHENLVGVCRGRCPRGLSLTAGGVLAARRRWRRRSPLPLHGPGDGRRRCNGDEGVLRTINPGGAGWSGHHHTGGRRNERSRQHGGYGKGLFRRHPDHLQQGHLHAEAQVSYDGKRLERRSTTGRWRARMRQRGGRARLNLLQLFPYPCPVHPELLSGTQHDVLRRDRIGRGEFVRGDPDLPVHDGRRASRLRRRRGRRRRRRPSQ